MCCGHMWFLFFIYQLKSQIKYISCAAVEFVENITHPREYVSIYVSFTEKKQYSNVCVLLELLTQLKSNEEKHN